jgi:NAD(P)-dependent dehydrogenase (short-subunit alcohol dehydrogenase family)
MNRNNLKDKVVLITGGTSGIGKVTAQMFAADGAKVVIAGRRDVEGNEVVSQIEKMGGVAKFVKCDVSNESEVKNLIDSTIQLFGSLNIAFNNAGIEQSNLLPLCETPSEEYHRVMNINVLGVYLSMKYEIQAMLKSGGGSIVNTSSIAGHSGMSGASIYVASKHAVEGFTKSAALELADKGIRVNSVSPGAVVTDMLNRFAGGENSEMGKYLASLHPMGRIGKPEEIGNAVLFLAGEASSFITGSSINIDGGWLAK